MSQAWENFKANAYAFMDAGKLLIELEKVKPKWATASLLARRSGVDEWKIVQAMEGVVGDGKAEKAKTRDGRTVYRYLDKGSA